MVIDDFTVNLLVALGGGWNKEKEKYIDSVKTPKPFWVTILKRMRTREIDA